MSRPRDTSARSGRRLTRRGFFQSVFDRFGPRSEAEAERLEATADPDGAGARPGRVGLTRHDTEAVARFLDRLATPKTRD